MNTQPPTSTTGDLWLPPTPSLSLTPFPRIDLVQKSYIHNIWRCRKWMKSMVIAHMELVLCGLCSEFFESWTNNPIVQTWCVYTQGVNKPQLLSSSHRYSELLQLENYNHGHKEIISCHIHCHHFYMSYTRLGFQNEHKWIERQKEKEKKAWMSEVPEINIESKMLAYFKTANGRPVW